MADLKKTIQIIFSGVDDVSDDISNINNSIGGFAGGVESATQPLADLSVNILKVEAAITAMGIAVLLYSTSQAGDLQDAQIGLQKVLGDSEGNVNQYTDAISSLSLQFGVMGKDTTDAVTAFKQAGFSIDESLKLVETALTGVKIAELSADDASNLLIATLKGVGGSADDAAHFLDAWNEVSNTSAVTAGQLAEATALLSPVARTAGLSFDDMVGLTTPIIEVFRSSSEAANALKVGLANLISDTPRVTDALESLGIAQKDANGELRLSGDILADLGAKWGDLTTSQQANYGQLLFGKEQFARMSTVLNEYDTVLKVTIQSINSQGSALTELAIAQNKSIEVSNKFKVAMNEAAIAVGTQFLDGTNNTAKGLTNLAISFKNVVDDGGLKPLFDLINPLLDEFEKNLNTIAKNLPDAFKGINYSDLIQSFKDLGFEFAGIFGDIDLSTPEGLTKALQGIIDAFTTLNNVTAGIVSGLEPLISAFSALAGSATESDGSTAKLFGNFLGYGASINVLSGLLSDFSGVMGTLTGIAIDLLTLKALGGLPASLEKAAISSGKLLTVLGKAGLVGAAGSAGIAIGTLIGETELVKGAFGSWFEAIDKLTGGPLSQLNDKLAENEIATKKLIDEIKKQPKVLEEVSESTVNVIENIIDYDKVVSDAVKSQIDLEQSEKESILTKARLVLATKDVENALLSKAEKQKLDIKLTQDAIDSLNGVERVSNGYFKTLEDGNKIFVKNKEVVEAVVDEQKKLEDELKRAEEATIKATKAFLDYEVQMEKIASNERIKTLELTVDLKVAQVEAETKRIQSAFESINETFATSTQAVTDLAGIFAGLTSHTKASNTIEEFMERNQLLAEENIRQQGELIEAQIRRLDATTDKIQSGESLITVDGGDLQPELQSIMESLFASIRIQMSANFEDFLLGTGI